MKRPSPVVPSAPPKRAARWLPWVLVAYVLLASVYSVSTPILEAPDEMFHFPLVDHIADARRLPVQNPAVETAWHQEGSQPPLYYLLAAPLVWSVDRSDLAERLIRNPHARIGVGLAQDNHVTLRHDWEAEAAPWQRTALAVHVVRLFSVMLGVGTIAAIYDIARLAVPDEPAVHALAVLLAAFNPMFLFITASVNNDNLVNLLSALALAQLLALWRGRLHWWRLWPLALTLALASLSKLSGLALYPVAALVIALVARRDSLPLRRVIRAGLIIVVVWLVVAGWWYARNLQLYGEPTGLTRMIEIIGARPAPPTAAELMDEFEGLRLSFWGVFGMLNVIGPDVLFDYTAALTLLAVFGLIVNAVPPILPLAIHFPTPGPAGEHRLAIAPALPWIERRQVRVRWSDVVPALILALHALIVFLALLNWTRRTPASQGRLLFPALGPLATLAALGLARLLPVSTWRRAVPLLALPLVVLAAAIPFATLMPTYRPPPAVAAAPDLALPVAARFGPIELLAVDVRDAAAIPGDERAGLGITLYWRPLAHTEEDMSLYVQALGLPNADGELELIGKIDTYPGGGLLRTTRWELGRIYADSYRIYIEPGARTPVQATLKIGWRDFDTGVEFDARTLADQPRAPVIIHAGRIVGAEQRLTDGKDAQTVFDHRFRLNRSALTPASVAPGGVVSLALEWEALGHTRDDFTVLIHLIDPAAPESPLAQADGPPLDNRWPTSAWERDVPFVDPRQLAIPPDAPPGDYRIAVGFYRPDDMTRLPLQTDLDTLPGAVLLPQIVTVEATGAHD